MATMQARYDSIEVGMDRDAARRALDGVAVAHEAREAGCEIVAWSGDGFVITLAFTDGAVARKSIAALPHTGGGCLWAAAGAIIAAGLWVVLRGGA